MIAPATKDETVDDRIAVIRNLRNRQFALLDMPMTREVLSQLIYLRGDYLRLLGKTSHNYLSMLRRIEHYTQILETQSTMFPVVPL